MKHNEQELRRLKTQVCEMGNIVLLQLIAAQQCLTHHDTTTARSIINREKRINAYELSIDRDIENYIALYTPVAIDLRLAISLIKITLTLERIGDFARGIAEYILDYHHHNTIDIIAALRSSEMLDNVIQMLSDCIAALDAESTHGVRNILERDEAVDEIYHDAFKLLENNITSGVLSPHAALQLIIVLRKIERIGDHCSNMAEELVFYIDAKVLKHHNKHTESDENEQDNISL